jgi:hypothetical protein
VVVLAACSSVEGPVAPSPVEPTQPAAVAPTSPAPEPTSSPETTSPEPAFYISPGPDCTATITSTLPHDSWPTVLWYHAHDRSDPNGSKELSWRRTFFVGPRASIRVRPLCCYYGLYRLEIEGGMGKWRDYGAHEVVCWPLTEPR